MKALIILLSFVCLMSGCKDSPVNSGDTGWSGIYVITTDNSISEWDLRFVDDTLFFSYWKFIGKFEQGVFRGADPVLMSGEVAPDSIEIYKNGDNVAGAMFMKFKTYNSTIIREQRNAFTGFKKR